MRMQLSIVGTPRPRRLHLSASWSTCGGARTAMTASERQRCRCRDFAHATASQCHHTIARPGISLSESDRHGFEVTIEQIDPGNGEKVEVRQGQNGWLR